MKNILVVEYKYVAMAKEILTEIVQELQKDGSFRYQDGIGPGDRDYKFDAVRTELYPQIYLEHNYRDGHIGLWGSGVSLLAFLLQEDHALVPDSRQCSNCAKRQRMTCQDKLRAAPVFLDYAPVYFDKDSNEKEAALDYLHFLRAQYPNVYIPIIAVKASDGVSRGWADLLIDMYRSPTAHRGITRIGAVQHDNNCPEYVVKEPSNT